MSLSDKIPNNVDLASDKKLQRALEAWQPKYLNWWNEMGPAEFAQDDIYLRTAISVEPGGWANFSHVKMSEYRWGIFLAPPSRDTISFGDNIGLPVWDRVPGEYRAELRRIIVTQADTEPASVEQQRKLGHQAPSLYDLRNLFQVNVEEGRHLWAMAYLLHRYFGRDGREEAEELLLRCSGDVDSPRILGAFNEPVGTFLDFLCFTMFADRDGKFQLAALAESGFDPLARSTQFMLTEEAHHLFVGETGIARIVRRTVELMKEAPGEDVKSQGGIPLDILQRYINKWVSVCLDLFGGDDSSNAANYFSAGLKGRFRESKSDFITDHRALDDRYLLETPSDDGAISHQEIPLRRALNRVLLDHYVKDCERAAQKWNRILSEAGVDFELSIPSAYFNRSVGPFAGLSYTPNGKHDKGGMRKIREEYLPRQEDEAYVVSIMQGVRELGKFANWIAPPSSGANRKPLDFEYVRFH